MTTAQRVPADQPTSSQLLFWRGLLAIFLTGTSLLTSYLNSGRALETGVAAALLLLYLSLGVAWLADRFALRQRRLLAAQLGFDTIVIAWLIQLTGGPHSAIPALYCYVIVLGASYLGPRAALIIAAAAAVFTGGAHAGLALGWMASGATGALEYTGGREVMVTLLHIVLFLVVGVVGGELASRSAQRRRLQERAAQQVQRTRTEVRSILDNLSSGLITIDLSGHLTRINPAACQLLDVHSENALGQHLRPVLGPAGEELARAVLDVAAGGPPLRRAELKLQRETGETPLGVTVNYLEDAEREVCGAVAIFTDLTDVQRMREHLRKADRLAGVGELAASIAHEIRNPLGSIRGSVEILASELRLEGHQAQLLELILTESARVNTIINDFLRFARLRPAAPKPVSCREFLDEVVLQIRQHVGVHGGGVELSYKVTPPDLQACMDPEQMVQLFLNLALNACEAMEYSGKLHIAAAATDGGSWCEFQIADDGPGVAAEHLERIFDPFMTTKKEGTGLGLPMVARIAHAHSGTVEVENGPERGVVFTLRLPQQESLELAARPTHEVVSAPV
jgi:two-component system sensor histidine kinase PilS (NtrC family)